MCLENELKSHLQHDMHHELLFYDVLQIFDTRHSLTHMWHKDYTVQTFQRQIKL